MTLLDACDTRSSEYGSRAKIRAASIERPAPGSSANRSDLSDAALFEFQMGLLRAECQLLDWLRDPSACVDHDVDSPSAVAVRAAITYARRTRGRNGSPDHRSFPLRLPKFRAVTIGAGGAISLSFCYDTPGGQIAETCKFAPDGSAKWYRSDATGQFSSGRLILD